MPHALITQLRAKRETLAAEAQALLDLAVAENRTDLTPEEGTTYTARRGEIADIDTRLAEYTEAEEREQAAAAANARLEATSTAATPTSNASVTGQPTYRKGGQHSFLRDAFAARSGDPEAAGRIYRNQAEMKDEYSKRGLAEGVESRVGLTGNYSGLTVPIYLVDEYAAVARAGRPFADAMPSADLPPTGMTVNISRITTGSTTAVQATENTGVSETDIDDTLLTIPVVSIAGAESVSFQALDRAALSEDIIVEDMVSSYETTLDNQLVNGSGAAGQHLGILNVSGINAVTYTDATPTVAEFLSKLADGIQQVNSNRFSPAQVIFMAPRRWGWMVAGVDANNRPLVVPAPNANFNAQGFGDPAAYGTVVGTLLGLPVITDANIPINLGAGTNEDRVIVTRAADHRLWEDPGSPLFLSFERRWSPSKKNLVDVAVVYGYSAFTAGRYPAATSVISGTGLITPTF